MSTGKLFLYQDKVQSQNLIRQMNTSPRGIAIAVLNKTSTSNHESIPEIIPQQQWTTYLLLNQQNILIIKATQGG